MKSSFFQSCDRAEDKALRDGLFNLWDHSLDYWGILALC